MRNNKTAEFLSYLTCLLAALVYSACEPDYGNLLTSPKDLPPSIFAFLNTAADSQYVILHNATPTSGDYAEFLEKEYQLFRQAKVTLSNGSGNFSFDDRYELVSAFHEDFEHDFIFVSAQRVQAGEGYALRVDIPQKNVYTAATIAPGNFQILTPIEKSTLAVSDSLEITWTLAPGAKGYRIGVQWFFIDSTDFKRGRTNQVYKRYGSQTWYTTIPAQHAIAVRLNYYESFLHNAANYDWTLLTEETILFVEALDEPAWLSRDLNRRGATSYGGPDEVRTMPGSYSNIQNGRGLMSAVTTKTIHVILPAQKR